MLLEGRIVDIFGRMLRDRYLSIAVKPPGCLAAGTVVPVPAFPDTLPRYSNQEIPERPEAPTRVCECTSEGCLLCGAEFFSKKKG